MLCTSRIQITYGTTPGPEHGGGGGSESFFILEPNEYIVEIEGRVDDRLDYAPLGASKSVSTCEFVKCKTWQRLFYQFTDNVSFNFIVRLDKSILLLC